MSVDEAAAICALFLLLACCLQAFAAPQANTVDLSLYPSQEILPRAASRVLHFQKDKSAGLLYIRSCASRPDVSSDKKLHAQGTIAVPANAITRLEVGETFFQDPALIKDLAPDSIDILILRLSSMADAEEGLCDNALAHIGHLADLQAIYMDRSDASDLGLSKLAGLTGLRLIEAGNSLVQGRALKNLTNLKELRTLRLPGTALDQDSLKYLSALPKLDQLALTRTGMTSVGLKHLSACHNLKVLQLGQNKHVTDSDMQYLLPLKKLVILQLGGTSVTLAGIEKLKGLGLRTVGMPLAHYGPDEIAKLHKIFPQATIEMAHETAVQKNDDELKNLLSPISKDRGL
jgi:hypothetical protein